MKQANKTNLERPILTNELKKRVKPEPDGSWLVPLPLDSYPDRRWKEFFEEEQHRNDSSDRVAVLIENKTLYLKIRSDDLEELPKKVAWIEKVIQATNKRIEQYNKRRRARS